MKQLVKTTILKTGITNASEEEILEYILNFVQKEGQVGYVVTPNPEILVHAYHHKDFRSILNHAEISLSDGIGVMLAGKVLGKPLKERVTGTDLLEKLCKAVSNQPITVGFLGAKPGIAERAAECLARKYPGLRVVFAASEWSEAGFKAEAEAELRIKNNESRVKSKEKDHNSKFIIHNSVDVLFVAYGFPKQEQWMADNLNSGKFRLAMGVGGAFDYMSGSVPRAPLYLRTFGLEWLFRLVVQPWRVKRQLALLEFLWLLLREKITS